MSTRAIPFVLILIACAIGGAAVAAAQKLPEPARTAPAAPNAALTTPIEFYLAHGDADACGPGCSEWIAAEGKIDVGAADRFRQLLRKLADRRPPIYFHSPGGKVNDALELGRLIRDKKFEVSVGHTVPQACASDKQSANSCEARKRGGQAVEAEISPTTYECNSSCVYALAGGAVRHVPPWVKLGIHDIGVDPNSSVPRGVSLTTVMRLSHARVRSYLREMGIDDALFSAAVATPFESVRLLQRDEIVRFGLDRREFGETGWRFIDKPFPKVSKLFFVRVDGDQPHYIDAMIEFTCNGATSMNLAVARQQLPSDTYFSSTALPVARIAIGGNQIALNQVSAVPNFYVRSGFVKTLDGVGDDTAMELPGIALGRNERGNVSLNMDGFAAAYAKLQPRCAEAVKNLQAALRQLGTKPVVLGAQANKSAQGTWTPQRLNSELTPVNDPRSLELKRIGTAEQKLRLDFLHFALADCTTSPVEVNIVERPQHGVLFVEDGQAFPDFPNDDPRAACNTRKSDGKFVFYQPNSGYLGTDSTVLYVVSATGQPLKRHYSIEVK
jgi:hypothetical protein